MKTLLKINSSILTSGNANRLADAFVTRWQAAHPQDRVIERDLTRDPIPHLDEITLTGFGTPAEKRTPGQAAAVALSDTLIAELRAADVIVLGVPMYNFGIPSPLKAWIDHIARAGITFKYSESGPVGLLQGKKVYVLAARGGLHAGSERDAQTQYLRTILGFLGMTDIEFVYAEGLAMGVEYKTRAEQAALSRIESLTARQAA
ncbi:MAG: FMN-dependent NADH-azoreductase [Nevskiales bacterium]